MNRECKTGPEVEIQRHGVTDAERPEAELVWRPPSPRRNATPNSDATSCFNPTSSFDSAKRTIWIQLEV